LTHALRGTPEPVHQRKSGYAQTQSLIDYPAEGNYGVNILVPDDTLYFLKQSENVSFAANVTKVLSLMVRITGLAQDTVTVSRLPFLDAFF
jgi:hypothetical protein